MKALSQSSQHLDPSLFKENTVLHIALALVCIAVVVIQ